MDVEKVNKKVEKIRRHLRVATVLMEQVRKECRDHPYPVGNFPYPECLGRRSGHNCPLALKCADLKVLKDALHEAMRASYRYLNYLEAVEQEEKEKREKEKERRLGLVGWPGGEGT